uniref:Uncharacterized protein n=1 Tax=Setaria italica TaxID=4555 RepID=K3YBN8_SETIT
MKHYTCNFKSIINVSSASMQGPEPMREPNQLACPGKFLAACASEARGARN